MKKRRSKFVPGLVIVIAAAAACGGIAPTEIDGGEVADAGTDAPAETGTDAGTDAPVDLEPPETTIVGGPPELGRESIAQFELASSEPGSSFRCQLDTTGAQPCTTPFVTVALADGTHELLVAAVDAAGNPDPTPAAHRWTIDTEPPVVTITAGVAGGGLTNDTTPTFTFTLTGAAVAPTCGVDGAGFALCVGSFTTPPLSQGAHTIEIRTTDAAGNPAAASRTFTVDTVAPEVILTAAPPALTNLRTATVAWTSSESAGFSCRVDGGTAVACGNGTSGSRTLSSLNAGDHGVVVTATDAAGNSRSQTATWTIDLTSPSNLRFFGTPAATYLTSVTYTFGASEDAAWECTVRIDSSGVVVDGPRACGNGASGSVTYGTALPGATVLEVEVRATDLAGNPAASPLRHLLCRGSASTCFDPT